VERGSPCGPINRDLHRSNKPACLPEQDPAARIDGDLVRHLLDQVRDFSQLFGELYEIQAACLSC
jgi:hypothetical protein